MITEGCAILLWIHSSAWKNQRVPSILASSSRVIAALISHWIFQLLFVAILKIYVFRTHILLQLLECIAEGSFCKIDPICNRNVWKYIKRSKQQFLHHSTLYSDIEKCLLGTKCELWETTFRKKLLRRFGLGEKPPWCNQIMEPRMLFSKSTTHPPHPQKIHLFCCQNI